MYQISVRAIGRLIEAAEFDNIVLKPGSNGALVRLGDVGHAELGAEDYSGKLRYNGYNGIGIGVSQLPTANALDVDKAVRAELARLSKRFPPGLRYAVAFDTTTFVGDSIREVLKTLVEAIVFVMLVMLLFLQDWRSTLIPAVAIPVSLVGTFAFISLLNFSINTLTLFGIVLATGLVVDDAIVVIENIQRHMGEEHCDSHVAASEAMGEVTGAVVATSLVLVAVFVPVAFFPGTTGLLYKQFSLTIAFSIAISAFNSLTFTPSLSALLLRPRRKTRTSSSAAVEHVIHRTTAYYVYSAKKALKLPLRGPGNLLCRPGRDLRRLQDGAHRLRSRRRPGLVHDHRAGAAGRIGGVHLAGHAARWKRCLPRRRTSPAPSASWASASAAAAPTKA